jgi:PAS domain S-box-containing protein
MEKQGFNFDEDSFNELFPFYFLIDSDLKIKGIGKSLAKAVPTIKLNHDFSEVFTLKRPSLETHSLASLRSLFNQLVLISTTCKGLNLRGQFQKYNDSILFVGSPWFTSMDQVIEKNLRLNDFAFHDPLLDLLHVLKNQEITTLELKELLIKINNQKKDLTKDKYELNRLSLVASANLNGIIFTTPDGKISWCNDAYLKLCGFSREEVIGRTPIQVGICEQTDKEGLKKMTVPFFNGEMFDVDLLHGRKDGSYFWAKTKGQPILDSEGKLVEFFAMVEDITEKKNADFQRIESENRLSFFIVNLQTAVILEDENRKILLTNKKFCSMFNLDMAPESFIGVDYSNSVENSKLLFKNPDLYEERVNSIFQQKKAVYNEEIEFANGRFFERSYIPIFRDGVYKGSLRSYVDITIKKQLEQRLQNEKDKYGNIVANMNLGLIEVDQDDSIILVNNSFCDISGYTVEELIGKKLSSLLFTEESKQLIIQKDVLRRKGVSDSYEVQIKNKKGELKHWLISGAPNYDINGVVIGSIGIHLDITEQKEQEEKLYVLSLIAEKNVNAVVITDGKGKLEWANSSFEKFSGYTKEELLGIKPGTVLQGAETDPETVAYLSNQISKGEPFNCEIINYSKEGKKYWVQIQGQALHNNKDGKVTKFFAIQENITAKKELEDRFHLLSLIAEKNINAVVIYDVEGRIEWVNPSFERISGYTNKELVGLIPGNILQGEETNPETIEYLKNQISMGEPFNCEIINYSKTGEKYWVQVQGQALYNKKGEVVRVFAIEENITDKKLLEYQREVLAESLAKTHKELEDYAQIVSHDLKSPLRSIHSLLTWIKEDNDKEFNDQTLQYFSMIENKVEKMDHLIQGILTYSKIDKEEIDKEWISTQRIVESIIEIIHIPEHIKVTIKNKLPIIHADRYRIQQLFQNIIGNAVNYIENESGLVEIASEEFKDHFLFSIKDNGVGIAKEHHKKIFNTFQSYTKSQESTGLGLAIVKKVVDAYHGKIWVESAVGAGATFFVKLNKLSF